MMLSELPPLARRLALSLRPLSLRAGFAAAFFVAPEFAASAYFFVEWVNPFLFVDNAALECMSIIMFEIWVIVFLMVLYPFVAALFYKAKKRGEKNNKLEAALLAVLVFGAMFTLLYEVIIWGLSSSLIVLALYAWHLAAKFIDARRMSVDEQTRFWLKNVSVFLLFLPVSGGFCYILAPNLGWTPGVIQALQSGIPDMLSEFPDSRIEGPLAAWLAFYFFITGVLAMFWPRIAGMKNVVKFSKDKLGSLAQTGAPPAPKLPPVREIAVTVVFIVVCAWSGWRFRMLELPLDAAVRAGDIAKVEKILDVRPELANATRATKKLLGGVSPLHAAAELGRMEIAEYLVARGADVNAITNMGKTPYKYAVAAKQPAMAKYLLSRSSSPALRY